jgi:hypothetical protein
LLSNSDKFNNSKKQFEEINTPKGEKAEVTVYDEAGDSQEDDELGDILNI